MAKSKTKKKTKAKVPKTSKENRPTGSANAQVMGGHNIDGWTETQIAAYNELLLEREKLEKQRTDLEIKSAKSHANRALVNENVTNIDSVFKLQKVAGQYIYTGSSFCCIELTMKEPCRHETCTRSRTDGVSFSELDIIKYYAMRIPEEKTERRRNALRKQRDAELIKIKRQEDEARSGSIRKSAARNESKYSSLINSVRSNHTTPMALEHDVLAGTTKETQRLVSNILEQLDDLRMDLQAGRISTTEMQKKLDAIDEEMQAAQLKPTKSPAATTIMPPALSPDLVSSTKAFQGHIKRRIVHAEGGTYSKAFYIMEHFLGGFKPGDFQAAISELKDVIGLSGPLDYELQNSFNALEEMFLDPDGVSQPGPDGEQEPSSIIDLVAKMKDTLQRTGQLPDGTNAKLVNVFENCIKLENDGEFEMMQAFTTHTNQHVTTDLSTVLSKIKSDLVTKSPIPRLTEQKLETEMQAVLDLYDVRRLMFEVKEGVSESHLDAFMTTLVMGRAQKVPEKYVETITRFYRAFERLRDGLQDKNEFGELAKTFYRVETKMQAFVATLAQRKAKNRPLGIAKIIETVCESVAAHDTTNDGDSDRSSEYNDTLPPDVSGVISAAWEKLTTQDMSSTAHLKLRAYIADHGQMGLWPLWLKFSENGDIDDDLELHEKTLDFEECMATIMSDDSQGLKKALIHLFEAGMCPGISAGIISQVLTDSVASNPERARAHMRELAGCIQGLPQPVTQDWSRLFQQLALAMTQLYVALYTNASHLFPSLSPLQFAVSSMSMVVSYVCLTRSQERAVKNWDLIRAFVSTCMSTDGVARSEEFYEAAGHFGKFCSNDEYRCTTLDPCSTHTTPSAGLRPGTHSPTCSQDRIRSESIRRASRISTFRPTLQCTIIYCKRSGKKSGNTHRRPKSTHASYDAYNVERAVKIFELSATKALRLMQIGTDEVPASSLNASDGLVSSVEEVAQLTSVDNLDSANDIVKDDLIGAGQFIVPKHMDELQANLVEFAPALQTPQDTSATLGEEDDAPDDHHVSLCSTIANTILSGKYPDPLQRLRWIIDQYKRMDDISEELVPALEDLHVNIASAMETPAVRHEFETKRFKFCLEVVGADSPTPDAMHDLASQDTGRFEEFCALLASVRAAQGHSSEEIRGLCSDVLELVGNGALDIHAQCVENLARIALQDWASRTQLSGRQTGVIANQPLNPSCRQVGLITQLSKLSHYVNRRKAFDNEIRKNVGKSGGIGAEEFKLFEHMTASEEERLKTSREIASAIAVAKDYSMVVAFLKQG